VIKWIKNKLQGFLGIHTLQDQYIKQNAYCRNLESQFNRLETKNDDVVRTSNAILDQFNLAVDVYPKEWHHSWAVICIKGKPEYVKFIDLKHQDARELQMFIKRFEGTNRVIDAPHREFFM
jgi:hypothetical protein